MVCFPVVFFCLSRWIEVLYGGKNGERYAEEVDNELMKIHCSFFYKIFS